MNVCDIHTNLANKNICFGEESSLYFFPNMSALQPWHQLPQIDLEQKPFLLLVVSAHLKNMRKNESKLFPNFQVDFLNLWCSAGPKKSSPKIVSKATWPDFPKSTKSRVEWWNPRGEPCNQNNSAMYQPFPQLAIKSTEKVRILPENRPKKHIIKSKHKNLQLTPSAAVQIYQFHWTQGVP